MSQLIADAHMRAKLEPFKEAVDIVDESGHKLGRFVPEPLCPWEPDLSEEEVERRIRESPGRTLAEIWERLGVK